MEVLERAGCLGQPDAVTEERNTGNEGVGSVDLDASALLAASIALHSHVDRPRVRREHPPKSRRTLMANGGAVTERKHRRHASAFEGEFAVADGIHTAMKVVQPAGLEPSRYCVLAEACIPKLR
jgi:hypothetical protein